MKSEKINEVKRLMKELGKAISEMETEEKENRKSEHGDYLYPSPKHRGAVRRKSMDLTRALADMRKP